MKRKGLILFFAAAVLFTACKPKEKEPWIFTGDFLKESRWEGSYTAYKQVGDNEISDVTVTFTSSTDGEYTLNSATTPFTYKVEEEVLRITADGLLFGNWELRDILEKKKRMILMKGADSEFKLDISKVAK